jgi:hypothetical protein
MTIFAVKLFGAVLASFVGLSVARSEKFNPYTQVTLVAYLCNGVTCIHEPVPPKMMWRVRSNIIWEAMVFRCPIITCSANTRVSMMRVNAYSNPEIPQLAVARSAVRSRRLRGPR